MTTVFSNGDAYIEVMKDGEVYEYPINYGTTECSAWDLELQPDCADENGPLEDAPEFCPDEWCYIDQNKCSQGAVKSTLFPDSDLYYSYDVCPM